MYPNIEAYHCGMLKVSDIHSLYYELSGNKDGKPIVFLHGGPGSGSRPNGRGFFNPEKYNIILFDQRGAGKSTPRLCLEENTTWDLVNDIECLREHLNIDKWHVFGGSWGSTLALIYAQTHPGRVLGLILRGIFTLRKVELDFFYQKGTSLLFPEAWEKFVGHIPEKERDDLIRAYHSRMSSPNQQTRTEAAKSWAKWEASTCQLQVDQAAVHAAIDQDNSEHANTSAYMETHYFFHKGWIRDGQILEKQEIDKIRHIPTIVAMAAYDLKKAWPEIELNIVPDAGHSAAEPGIRRQLVMVSSVVK
ncbi:proline iminopeptidase [Hysterangium stoloniferum]|nr:proline iminopeptidase [Hysterangium stoloniferum]